MFSSLEDLRPICTIGKGSFGCVQIVKPTSGDTHAVYALKSMLKTVVIKKQQVEHVRNERNVLAMINHPFIVNFVAAFQNATAVYILLEFVNGGELLSQLVKLRRLPMDSVAFYTAEVASVFGYLHTKRIAYRDVKPENILLDSLGHVKLADFGFAKVCTEMTFTLCGTPEYLSPEVIRTAGHGTPVDWWGLGILIYELACGSTPFRDRRVFSIYRKILEGVYTCPSVLTKEAVDVVGKFLDPNTRTRLGCGGWLLQDVQAHLFFEAVPWHTIHLRTMVPPFSPPVKSDDDSKMFDSFPDLKGTATSRLTAADDALFKDWEGFKPGAPQ
eukprot:NODE_11418_length_1288_cov_3.372093.p1 GENE.NODE_11418_length_1288_cov_3.372093~~NODE_11418_length_1288_cov_3.372093.p1  ORF type:complete len:329 (+),score=38.03 NODE_11418_length_1288_cov_3.372093:49-1035(+)